MNNTRFEDCSPIFVVGAPRSGTTLLRLILNSHPNIGLFGELHFFDQILQMKRLVPSLDEDECLEEFFSLIENVYAVQYLADHKEVFERTKQELKSVTFRTYETFYKYTLEEYAKTRKTTRFGEKTPQNIRYLDDLKNIFPNAKIIHIVRDPRAVVASLIKMPWTANDAIINSLKWKIDIQYSHGFSNRTDSYMELRYEDLVTSPENQLKQVCEFVGEAYTSAMLDFYQSSKSYIKNEPWKDGTSQPINTTAMEKWRQELSGAQIYIIEKTVGSLLNRFGYKPSPVSFSSKLISPIIFLTEIAKYLKYKHSEIRMRKKSDQTVYGETTKLYNMLFKSLLRQ